MSNGLRCSSSHRYEVWIDPQGQARSRVAGVVAGLLGIDVRQAGKLMDAGLPVCKGVSQRRARFLRARFADFGLKARVDPELDNGENETLAGPPGGRRWGIGLWCAQATHGFTAGVAMAIGMILLLALLGRIARWIEEPLEGAIMIAPLVASCAVGACWDGVRSGSIGWKVLSMIVAGVIMACLATAGSWAIVRWLGQDKASDVTSPLAALAFDGLCVALAAPLSAALASLGTVPRARS